MDASSDSIGCVGQTAEPVISGELACLSICILLTIILNNTTLAVELHW